MAAKARATHCQICPPLYTQIGQRTLTVVLIMQLFRLGRGQGYMVVYLNRTLTNRMVGDEVNS